MHREFSKWSEWGTRAVANRTGTVDSQISKIGKGRLSSDLLFSILVEFDRKWSDLPGLPSKRELWVRGCKLATFCLRERALKSVRETEDDGDNKEEPFPPDEDLIPEDVLLCMWVLAGNERYLELRLQRLEPLSRDDWEMIAVDDEFLAQIDSYGIPPPHKNGAELERLHIEWGELVRRCMMGIPFRWFEDDEDLHG